MSQDAKILVIDDDDLIAKMCSTALSRAGFRPVSALDGRSALTMAAEESPETILLDIGLPDLDGYEVLSRLKSDPALADIPVIMLTGRLDPDDVVQALDKGAHDYLRKPFDVAEMLARVRTAVRLLRAERSLNHSRLRMLSELSLARAIQLSMQPPVKLLADLEAQGLRIFHDTRLAKEVSGDLFDVRRQSSDLVSLALADCKGTGAAAGMMTMAVHAMLLGQAPTFLPQARDPLYQLDVQLKQVAGAATTVGMTYLSWHLGQGRVTLAQAGMPQPLCVESDGEDVYPLNPGAAPPLGGGEVRGLKQVEHHLAPGDKLVLYTTGLLAARRGQDGVVGLSEGDIMDLLRGSGGLSAAELGGRILDAWQDRVGPEHAADCSLVILERLEA